VLDTLFSPLALGPVEIRNRIVSTSHQTSLVHDHLPTADLIAYHETRARGGVGLICIEATATHHTGLLTPHTIGGYLPEIVPVFRRLSDAVHAHGAKIMVQLFHGGREVIASPPRPAAVAPSSVPSPRFKSEPRALSRREITEMIDGYRQAAVHAAQGGIDGVEVCAGFNYLPTQFLSPHVNRRTDEYGGSFENRLRFLREVCEAMREGIGPDGAVGCRLTDEHWSPDANTEDELAEAARVLSDAGLIDYLSVALGSSTTYRGSSWIVPPSPIEHNAILPFARRMKAASTVPVIATGRIVEAADANAMIERGDCDACGMTRAMITDPGMPDKARAGKPYMRCIGCNQGCIGHYHSGLPIACTINPWTGFERRLPPPASRQGTAVIVGAGPAGAAAAACAHMRGMRVVVFEATDGPGGQMRLATAAAGHAEIAGGLIATADRWLSGCDVRYSTVATADDVLAESPDRVIVATGAGPYDVELPGGSVVGAWDVLAGAETGRRVVVSDWGGDWTGLAVAELLAARGCDVRLATSAAAFGEAIHQYQRNQYLERLDLAGVELIHHVRPIAVEGDVLVCRNVFSEREVRLEGVDTVVASAGRSSDSSLFEELEDRGAEPVRVGDALGPRSFEEAIREGTEAGLEAVSAPAALH
jgi:2,4-dienoyl-CoA reductase-like NADH-dependent reductase (Old Yellow Enzyme family)/thioredoxin reductase